MKTFNHLFEVYDRSNNNIVIAQGSEKECISLADGIWNYSVRLAKVKYISIDELPNLIETYLEEAFISSELGYKNPEKYIKEKFEL